MSTSIIEWVKAETSKLEEQRRTRVFFLARKQVTGEVIDRLRQLDREEGTSSRVYFVQEGGGNIKIGVSKHLKERMRALRTAVSRELVLLATVEGGRRVEAILHNLFSHVRFRGEWFFPVEELLEYIEKEGEPSDVTERRERDETFEKRRNTRIVT